MTENIEDIVHAAQGQGPSPDFVARLRAQIVAETEGSGSVADGGGRVRTADALPNSLGTVVGEPDDEVGGLGGPVEIDERDRPEDRRAVPDRERPVTGVEDLERRCRVARQNV